jgi:hypothetical protein
MRASLPRLAVWLLAAAAAVVALLLASPSRASRHERLSAASSCPSFARVKSFHGLAGTLSFGASASANDASSGGTETIVLSRNGSNLPINLTAKVVSKVSTGGLAGVTIFVGKGSGGTVSVGDTFANSGSGLIGKLQSSGPPSFITAAVGLNPTLCIYQLEVAFGAPAVFSGDETVDPGKGVTAAVYSPREHIPASLKLSGSAQVEALHSGCPGPDPNAPPVTGCYQFGGGWANDFSTLESCHSVEAVNCGPDDQPEGTASFSWSLTPKFAFSTPKPKPHPKKKK